MLKIGEFSKLSLTTIKTLRYYEKEELLLPFYIDKETGYRFYETYQLTKVSEIKALRQIGFSIEEIKELLKGESFEKALKRKKEQLENSIQDIHYQLRTIKYLMEDKSMEYQAVIKKLPKCIVYYEERAINGFDEITNLVLESASECERLNPGIECVKPDYCFIEYLDGEYKEKDIHARYSQAVLKKGNENERIHFKELPEVDAICVYHRGEYSKLGDAYSYILNFAKANGYQMAGLMREVYIDGCWNQEKEEDYLTEIQMPITKK